LTAAKDVNIKAAKEIGKEHNNFENIHAAVGAAISFNGNGASIGVTAEGEYGKGKANGDNINYRNSYVGSSTGQTNISAGKELNINGGQILGKGVKIDAQKLNIETVQNAMNYNSNQFNASVDFTIGYGASAGGNVSASKIKANYQSINEQSGIFAGDDGYQINIKENTHLNGGLITSTANAEQNGKNRFETGTITFADLANKAEYKGEAFGIGISGSVKGDNPNSNSRIYTVDKTGMSNTMGYGRDKESQSSVTYAGINTANITIRDTAKQQALTGKSAEETIKAVKTNITLENHQNLSGRLDNNFDANKVQSEIDLQVEVTQEFSRNLQDYNRRQNQLKDKLKAQLERNEITQQYYNEQVEIIDRQNLGLNMVAGGLLAPSDSVLGVATSTIAPAASYQVGQYFKDLADQNPNGELTTSQKTAHIATHAILGVATASANGGNALSGAISAGGAEAITPVIVAMLYGDEVKPENLTAEQKETVLNITQALGAVSGSLNGDSSLDAYVGGTVATNAVENNYLGYYGKNNQSDFAKDLSRDCGKNGSPERCAATYNKYKEISYKQGFAYQGEDSKWEEYVAATYENKILPLCNGNVNCEAAVIQNMQINLVLYAGAPGEFKHAVEHSEIATNIKNGNWGTLGASSVW
ncbi:MAG: hemagglutinin repeat-containing protein, partial [Neisseriaceae bacterium]|nr:hemagglutinin repeat-containing protein [Neisseriaceae bacterium]